MRTLRKLVLLLLVCIPAIGSSDPIPGADDPALRSAALEWLHADDPTDAITEIGTMAANGNIAAAMLANRIHRQFSPFDFPTLDREGRRALWPDADGRFSSVYHLDFLSDPRHAASQGFGTAETPQDWIAAAQLLIDAEQLGSLKRRLSITLTNHPSLDIEAFLFTENLIESSDEIMALVWFFRANEVLSLEYLDNIDPERAALRRARWGQEIWRAADRESFSTALAEGRFSAIRALGFIRAFTRTDGSEFTDIPNPSIGRWADLMTQIYVTEPVPDDPQDLADFGRTVIHDASRSPYLRPIVNSCSNHCPELLEICVAHAVMDRLYGRTAGWGTLEPILTMDEYFSSHRAAQWQSLSVGLPIIHRSDPAHIAQMPQCYLDGAERLAISLEPQR